MTFKVILNIIENLCLHNDDILEKFWKNWEINKKNIEKKDDLEISR